MSFKTTTNNRVYTIYLTNPDSLPKEIIIMMKLKSIKVQKQNLPVPS